MNAMQIIWTECEHGKGAMAYVESSEDGTAWETLRAKASARCIMCVYDPLPIAYPKAGTIDLTGALAWGGEVVLNTWPPELRESSDTIARREASITKHNKDSA